LYISKQRKAQQQTTNKRNALVRYAIAKQLTSAKQRSK